MAEKATSPAIVVRDSKTRAEVHRVVMQTPFTDSRLERVLMGLLRTMDTERYFADDSECEAWLQEQRANRRAP